jgi:hypothetical protein
MHRVENRDRPEHETIVSPIHVVPLRPDPITKIGVSMLRERVDLFAEEPGRTARTNRPHQLADAVDR